MKRSYGLVVTLLSGAFVAACGGNNGLSSPTPTSVVPLQVVYIFKGRTDGEQPLAGLTDLHGTLYGTTQVGGAHGYGTIFNVNPSTGAERVLYSFKKPPDGEDPQAGLLVVNGVLYGTTHGGGTAGNGTVFTFTP